MQWQVPALTFAFGAVLGYLGHRLQIVRGKVDVQRERFLRKIAEVEQFLAEVLELEYVLQQLHADAAALSATKADILHIVRKVGLAETTIQTLKGKLARLRKRASVAARTERRGQGRRGPSQSEATYRHELETMTKQLNQSINKASAQREAIRTQRGRLLQLKHESAEIDARLEQIKAKIRGTDIDVLCRLIDPSKRLARLFIELLDIERTIGKEADNGELVKDASAIRFEIRKLLDGKIV